ncbi:MAG: hypothetical protein JW860_15760 [Sedimentisphaerales bacterium]|nr:hypothetical protein [Sedimentisphaerales bacterium]
MVKMCLWICLVMVVSLTLPLYAGEDDLRAELNQALEEIQQLRVELNELKQNSSWQYQQELTKMVDEMPAAAKDEGESGLIMPAGWKIQPYGYFKFDLNYDDSASNAGDYLIWVEPENSTTRSDGRISTTARQTRLGAKVFAPDIGDMKVMGRVEIDFYNPEVNVENKSTPQMRHAYGQISGADWSLLFGQTSDIISPLVPNTLNYTVGWFGGNIGYRHPQLQFSKWWTCPETEMQMKVETAVSRQIRQDADGFGVDDGHDTDTPTVLARLSCATPMAGKKLIFGVSGHYGTEEADWDHVGDDESDLHTWSVNGDLVVPLCDTLEFKGEMFWGENIDSYFGGIGQGVNTTTRDEIESIGAWAQLGYKPSDEWAFYGGAGFDDPTDSDLIDGNKSQNLFAFTNVNYFFSKYLSTGIEFTYMETDYKNSDNGDNFRVQHSWQLSF